ncbi:metallopeptidase family protein [Streptomyces polyrhachis]|uniref:Metallopeptidase family protein n=1 Tax=Streptomyces polyrhachis TaxID=1282885 RepID=A0ABW2GMG8_9ACTN
MEHAATTPDPASPERPEPAEPAAGPRPRRRDRHGRGMRGPLAPPQVPLVLSRAEVFGDLVAESAQRLERLWPQLSSVEFSVLDVPGDPELPISLDDEGGVPLGTLLSGSRNGLPEQIFVYRRPVELRAKNREERAQLVHEIIVEQVAELLGMAPETVDPQYGQE